MYRDQLPSSKAVNTWGNIYQAAITLFRRQGFHETTIRDIVGEANCSLGSFYRYFRAKEEIILALYEELSNQLEAALPSLDQGTIARRFRQLMEVKFNLLTPYDNLLSPLIGMMLDPSHPLGATSQETEIVRLKNESVFRTMVFGAKDRPKSREKCLQISRTLYGTHLMMLFLWFFDRQENKPTTQVTLDTVEDFLKKVNQFKINPLSGYVYNKLDLVFSGILQLPEVEGHHKLAVKVLDLVFRRRKVLPQDRHGGESCDQCRELHLPRVRYFIEHKQPIHMILPAFPAKSPNPDKVLGHLPDLGEEIALHALQELCDQIATIYSPGARITICADGRVFSDQVKVSEEEVTAYHNELRKMISNEGLSALNVIHLEDLIKAKDVMAARATLIERYGKPEDYFRELRQAQPHQQQLLNGIHRFIIEDQRHLYPDLSKSAYKKQCMEVAKQVVRRSDAWSALLAHVFPLSLRLSIHPQHPHSEKIGIHMTKAADNWITPWHGVMVLGEDGYVLQKKEQAVREGAQIIYKQGRPYWMEAHAVN